MANNGKPGDAGVSVAPGNRLDASCPPPPRRMPLKQALDLIEDQRQTPMPP